MAANNASRGGTGFLTLPLLGLLFIGLKLTGFGLITSQIDTAPKLKIILINPLKVDTDNNHLL